MSLNEPVFLVGGNVSARNKHWRLCERREIPYITVKRRQRKSFIDWDLWNINVYNLHLNKQAEEQLTKYINSLFGRRVCYKAVTGSSITGYLEVRRSLENEAIKEVWQIVANPMNWEIKKLSGYESTFNVILKQSNEWLANKQAEAAKATLPNDTEKQGLIEIIPDSQET